MHLNPEISPQYRKGVFIHVVIDTQECEIESAKVHVYVYSTNVQATTAAAPVYFHISPCCGQNTKGKSCDCVLAYKLGMASYLALW